MAMIVTMWCSISQERESDVKALKVLKEETVDKQYHTKTNEINWTMTSEKKVLKNQP